MPSFSARAARLLLAASVFAPSAWADIHMRDEGADGVTLSNLPLAPAAALAAARIERPGKGEAARRRLAPLVAAAAAAHGLPEALLTAVIEVESNFDPVAVSPRGATGLMQLMPGTARHLKVADARDPAANVDAGARYLKELLERFDHNLILALAAYNAGPEPVRRSGTVPPYRETQRYVPRVIRRYHGFETGAPARR